MMLTIPATLVETERAFSSCANLCNKLRTRLNNTLNILCFIRNNLKKPKQVEMCTALSHLFCFLEQFV